jgi:hypothetical protein
VRGRLTFAVAVCIASSIAHADRGSAAPTTGDESPVAARIVIDLTPAPGVPAWFASSFEQTIARQLAGFERLGTTPKQNISQGGCGADTGRACKLRSYRAAGIDVVLFGTVRESTIDYELYQTWTPARLEAGDMDIGRAQTVVGLEHETRDALHAVLKHGGLLDQKPYLFEHEVAGASAAASWSATQFALVLAVIVLLCLPFVWAVLIGRTPRAVLRMRSARRVGVAAALLALVAVEPGSIAGLAAASPALLAGFGGVGWGAFAVHLARSAFPPLDGLERMPHGDLVRILKTWCFAAGERLVVLAIGYGGLLVLLVWLAETLGIVAPWTGLVIAPAGLWLSQLWLSAWVDCIAARLDRRMVEGAPAADNPWSREVADYLNGYVRRTGWDLDPALLRQVVFLPGKHVPGGVVAYGGGATHVRIVIDRELLVMAMGPLIETKPDEKPVVWPDWTLARVGPAGKREATHEARARKQRPSYPGMQRKPLGQPATLLGYVTPAPGQLVPLISDNPQDLAIVRQLLSEHYPWFAPDPDEEFDATDPTDKDLLFGALVYALGMARRNDAQLATLKLALGKHAARIASPIRARVADAYATLNFARHHLIQFLHYSWRHDTAALTARARPTRLAAVSRQLLRDVVDAKQPPPAALRGRLVWLSQFFADPIVDGRAMIIRRITAGVAAAAVVVLLGIAVQQSIAYHPIYVERMHVQERDLQKGPADGEATQE